MAACDGAPPLRALIPRCAPSSLTLPCPQAQLARQAGKQRAGEPGGEGPKVRFQGPRLASDAARKLAQSRAERALRRRGVRGWEVEDEGAARIVLGAAAVAARARARDAGRRNEPRAARKAAAPVGEGSSDGTIDLAVVSSSFEEEGPAEEAVEADEEEAEEEDARAREAEEEAHAAHAAEEEEALAAAMDGVVMPSFRSSQLRGRGASKACKESSPAVRVRPHTGCQAIACKHGLLTATSHGLLGSQMCT
jgi:hypothetical protein